MNIQFNEARKTFRKTFYDLKEKNEKRVIIKIEPPMEEMEERHNMYCW